MKKPVILGAIFLFLATAANAEFVPGNYTKADPARLAKMAPSEAARGVMRPDSATLADWCGRYAQGPRAWNDPNLAGMSRSGYYSLLGNLQYTPSTRDQGYCGDCWAWAGVGCTAIEINRQLGVASNRLSVQQVNSCSGTGTDYACCGGWAEDLATYYQATGYCLPWSNSNASFLDTFRQCSDGSSTTACGAIATSPSYGIASCQANYITTTGVNQATAIANIKNQLNQGKAVWLAFFIPNATDDTIFMNFWNNNNESQYLDMSFVDGDTWTVAGWGHAVLCVGYDDSDPSNSVWIMLNSWGGPANRPNGIFLIDMDMSYNATFYDGAWYWAFYWASYDISFEGGGNFYHVASGDYNGDSYDDIAVYRPSTSQWRIRNLSNVYFGQSGDYPVPADYNGDGRTDLAVYRPSTGMWKVRNQTLFYFGTSGDRPIQADYNGDGSDDAAYFRPGSGMWKVRNRTTLYFGTSEDTPVPGDYNADGTADLAYFRPSSALWKIRNITTLYYGQSGDTPVPGDYGWWGAWRPAVFRASTSQWRIRTLTQYYFGNSSITPVPGDYDLWLGDDLAYFDPTTSLWKVKGFTRLYFGQSSDIPVSR